MVSPEIRTGSPDGCGLKSRPLLRIVRCLLLTIAVLFPASADLVNYTSIDVSGTGHGTVNEVLTFGNVGTGPNMVASGCVRWGVITPGFGDVYGGDCPTVTLGNMQDDSKSHTLRPGDIAVSSPFTLAIVLDASEPGSAPSVVVSQLILTFYSPSNGDVIFTADLNTPTIINDATPGNGGSGRVFGLDWDQASLAQGFIGASGVAFNDVRVGLGAELQLFDGHGYFWIGNIPGLVPEPPIPPSEVPEPATFLLFGGGLLALGLVRRRFCRN